MAETVFTCGQVLSLLDGVNLYGLEQSHINNCLIGEHMTGVNAPSMTLNLDMIAETTFWLLGVSQSCGERLKRDMVRQYPSAFAMTRLNALVTEETLTYEEMVAAYMRLAEELGIDLNAPIVLVPMSYREQQLFLQLIANSNFRDECLEILAVGTAAYVTETL